MKKIFTLLLIIFVLPLYSCSNKTVHYDYNELLEKVEKIEILDVVYDEELCLIIESPIMFIDENEKETFLLEVCEIEFAINYLPNEPSFPVGRYIKLYYYNGEVEHICRSKTTSFNDVYGVEEKLNDLINKYLNS